MTPFGPVKATGRGWRRLLNLSRVRREREICSFVPLCSRQCSADLRNQLTKELERNRHLALQKEVEAKEMQTKIDSAVRWSDFLDQAGQLTFRDRCETWHPPGSHLLSLKRTRSISILVLKIWLERSRATLRSWRSTSEGLLERNLVWVIFRLQTTYKGKLLNFGEPFYPGATKGTLTTRWYQCHTSWSRIGRRDCPRTR
jgi:hypothetical protein